MRLNFPNVWTALEDQSFQVAQPPAREPRNLHVDLRHPFELQLLQLGTQPNEQLQHRLRHGQLVQLQVAHTVKVLQQRFVVGVRNRERTQPQPVQAAARRKRVKHGGPTLEAAVTQGYAADLGGLSQVVAKAGVLDLLGSQVKMAQIGVRGTGEVDFGRGMPAEVY
uniref:(northern house mosquito) hypothetical protein n=1 Tax=Culex pipiens TaxID=7175 RepID=A0A8D8AWJ4_CULPI